MKMIVTRFKLVEYAMANKMEGEAFKVLEDIKMLLDRASDITKNRHLYKEENDWATLSEKETVEIIKE